MSGLIDLVCSVPFPWNKEIEENEGNNTILIIGTVFNRILIPYLDSESELYLNRLILHLLLEFTSRRALAQTLA